MSQESFESLVESLSDSHALPEVLEEAWNSVIQLTSGFVRAHDRFGFELVEKHSNPSLEDMLLSLKMMGFILNLLEESDDFDGSEMRKLLNAKQQIVWFERATLALKQKDKDAYESVVKMMRDQAKF